MDNYLIHYGILGMKWGVRRFQNPDGSLTEAGKKRYLGENGSLTEAGKRFLGGDARRANDLRKGYTSKGELTKDYYDKRKDQQYEEAFSRTDVLTAVRAQKDQYAKLRDKREQIELELLNMAEDPLSWNSKKENRLDEELAKTDQQIRKCVTDAATEIENMLGSFPADNGFTSPYGSSGSWLSGKGRVEELLASETNRPLDGYSRMFPWR